MKKGIMGGGMKAPKKTVPSEKSPYKGGQKQGSGGRQNAQRGMTKKPGTKAY